MAKNLGRFTDGATWYGDHTSFGRMIPLTNKSGAALETNDAVVLDLSNDAAVTTTTTEADNLPVFVVPAEITGNNVSGSYSIANDEEGWFYSEYGYIPAVEIDGAVSRGEYLTTSTTADKLTGSGLIAGTDQPTSGCVAIALAAGTTTVAALLMPLVDPPSGSSVARVYTAGTVSVSYSTAYADVFSTTLDAGFMDTDGDTIIIEAELSTAVAVNTTPSFRLTLGSTSVAVQAINARDGYFMIRARVSRTGAASQEMSIRHLLHAVQTSTTPYEVSKVAFATAAETLANSLALKLEAKNNTGSGTWVFKNITAFIVKGA